MVMSYDRSSPEPQERLTLPSAYRGKTLNSASVFSDLRPTNSILPANTPKPNTRSWRRNTDTYFFPENESVRNGGKFGGSRLGDLKSWDLRSGIDFAGGIWDSMGFAGNQITKSINDRKGKRAV
jgi:hypothetical protein